MTIKVELAATLKAEGFDRDHLPTFIFTRQMHGVPRIGDKFDVRVDAPDETQVMAVALVDDVHWQEDNEGWDVVIGGNIIEAYDIDGPTDDMTPEQLATRLGLPLLTASPQRAPGSTEP